jgi:putative membrane protein
MAELTSNDMARQRTEMAADRTLMAWVRTALSMISFGFTITKFFEYLHESTESTRTITGARNLGLTLAILGVAGLVAAVVHHQQVLTELGVTRARTRWSVTVVTAVAVAIIGVIVFISAVSQRGPF